MKRLICAFSLITGVALASASGIARADSIGGPGSTCKTCQGATYTLFTDFIDLNPSTSLITYAVHLLIDTSTYNGGGVAIDTVAVKIASAITGFSVVSAPAGSGPWTTFLNSTLNANGCTDNAGSGFGCATTLPPPAGGIAAAVGGVLEWVFDITFATNAGPIDPASIKVRYTNALENGNKVGALVSEHIQLQCPPGSEDCVPPRFLPEPSTLALLGLSLLALGYTTRRRRS